MEDTGGYWACGVCRAEFGEHSSLWGLAGMYCAECWSCAHRGRLSRPRDEDLGAGMLQLAWEEHLAKVMGRRARSPLADGCGDPPCYVPGGPSTSAGEASEAGGQGPQLRPAGGDGSGEAEEPPVGEDWFRSWEMG